MPEISFSLSRYDGPATVGGIHFSKVHLVESAEAGDSTVTRSWEGTAEVAKSEAPEVAPEWAFAPGPVPVRLPEGGVGSAYITDLTLTNGRFWSVELVGKGPAPMA